MDLSDYRREYADYCSEHERELYAHHAGLTAAPRLEPIRDRYADLWTREAIDDLKAKLDPPPTLFETERAGLRALVRLASRHHVESRAAEVTAELARCEVSARVVRGGEKFESEQALRLIAEEPDAPQRRELAARWFAAVRPCEDLRAARLETLKVEAVSLGFDDSLALYEDADGARLIELASQARVFLERTAPVYMSRLARWSARESPDASPNSLTYADALFFRRASHLDALFPQRRMRAAYGAAMEGLGVRVGTQNNINVDDEARPLKKPRAACFGVRPPEDVRLVMAGRAGADSYTEFFFEGGRAQQFGWTSRELASRHPEFIHAPDESARDGAGFLLSGLLHDAAWVGEHLHLRANEANGLAGSVALLELEAARRCCAELQYALALSESSDVRSERLSETYVSLLREATGFAHDSSTRLIDAEASFGAASRLRARLFAASLGEHLRSRHGRRWFASRAAGDELIDLWNTASRYTAEELARLAWGGALDFEILAEDLKAALDEE